MSGFSRRQFLRGLGLSGLATTMGGCASPEISDLVGRLSEPLNQSIEQALLNPQRAVPEFTIAQIEPEKLLVNGFSQYFPSLDPRTFRLTIEGAVDRPLSLNLEDIYRQPKQSMVIRHVCVEGWAAIVQWAGISLRHLVQLARPKPEAKYLYFQSADGYYESWDVTSALHPQTLLAYEMNGQPLPIPNGAPLRLASPIKLGYKQSKWVTRITLTPDLTPPPWLRRDTDDRVLQMALALGRIPVPRRGFWEDQGYEWFAGL